MKSLAALDIHYLIKEMEFLADSRVDKIYAPRKKEILIQFFVSGKGKHFLKIDEKSIYLSSYKPSSEKPSDFCMYLRKKIGNARLREITQRGFERIVEIIFETKEEKFSLIAELFSKGNILLLKEGKILVAAEYQKWKDRTIKPKEEYKHPEKEYDFFGIGMSDLKKLFSETKRESAVKSLAIDIGLGGVYSEEACLISEVDKNKKPSELDEKEVEQLFLALSDMRSKKIDPREVLDKDKVIDIIPFELKYYSGYDQEKGESFSSLLDEYFSKKRKMVQKKTANKEIDRIKEMIKKQKEDIEKLEKEEMVNKEKGEIIYENYQLLENLIRELRDISKEHSWEEIKKKLKGHKLIKGVNPKDKSVVVEI